VKKKCKNISEKELADKSLHLKLNAIIRLLIELNKNMNDGKFSIKSAAKMLHTIGLPPKEIADILGYKSRTSVAKYLYSERKEKSRVKKRGKGSVKS